MKSNTLLTYLLYALLATLLLSLGYKACQMQKEKQRVAKEEAEWQETLKKLYPEGDTTGNGSAYVSRDTATMTRASDSRSTPVTREEPKTNTAANKPATATKPSTTATAPTAGSTTTPKTTTTSTTKGVTAVQGVGSGKWEVRAGTFSQMENARDVLEKVIQTGYTNAEIKKRSDGKATVIVLRTNDKNKATQVAGQLTKRGIEAAVAASGK